MKNIQIQFLKIITAILFFFSIPELANAQQGKMQKADSLFKAKQYTQSLEIYQATFDEKKYSSAMLLKMAYINEGLGKVGSTLYFLKLFNLITQDEQAEKKMEDLAAKFKLSGYSKVEANGLGQLITRNIFLIQISLLLLISGLLISIFLRRKKTQRSFGIGVMLLLSISILFYINNYHSATSVIIAHDQTYLMEAPSAGANVSAVIGEGNLLQSLGHEDVWLKVRWLDKVVYVKENSVLKIEI